MKKFTKSLLSLTLALMLVFALAACGGDEDATDTPTENNSPAPESVLTVEQDPEKIAAAEKAVGDFLLLVKDCKFADAAALCVNPDNFLSDGANSYTNEGSDVKIVINSRDEKVSKLSRDYLGKISQNSAITLAAAEAVVDYAITFDYAITKTVVTEDGCDVAVAVTLYTTDDISNIFTAACSDAADAESFKVAFDAKLASVQKKTVNITLSVTEPVVEEVEEATDVLEEETEAPEAELTYLIDYQNSDIAEWNRTRG